MGRLLLASVTPERVPRNIYWDCYNGIRSAMQPKSEDDFGETFADAEKLYYKLALHRFC